MPTPAHTSRARLALFALCTASSMALSGCATLQVNSYVERGASLSQYQTFGWGVRDGLETGDPRLDNNPFFDTRVRSQVESKLTARGYAKMGPQPDLWVHYHARVNQRLDASSLENTGSGRNDDNRPFVYDAGTLVIDLVDRASNRVVWRGWADGTLDGAIDNQRWMEQRVDEAVAKILARLPPRTSPTSR